MSVELKIKSKHLALEPAIIRKEEEKLLKQAAYYRAKQEHEWEESILERYTSLQVHRTWNVRNEARATHLARAFISKMPYSKVEKKVHNKSNLNCYILPRIVSMVAKYGRYEDRIYKKWIRELNRMDFEKSEYKTLQEKIEQWLEI